MPFSNDRGKKYILQWVKQKNDIKNIIDIGPGAGTYPVLFKNTNNLLINAKWVAVEAWKPYISEYNLEEKYDIIYNEDARTFDWNKVKDFDLAIFGDVLEHMTKEEAQSLVSVALNYCKYVIISIPIKHMPQGAEYGNPFEIHVKDNWTHDEVLASFPNIVKSMPVKKIGVYWLEK